jgi:hypothetical protein
MAIVAAVSRVHLFELHEQPRFPAGWRDLLTEFLSFYASVFKPYVCVAPLLANALEQEGTPRIVDLCSGAPSCRRFRSWAFVTSR